MRLESIGLFYFAGARNDLFIRSRKAAETSLHPSSMAVPFISSEDSIEIVRDHS